MTSHSSTLVPGDPGIPKTRVPLRLALSTAPGHATLDGAWWPQSRDLEVELADLVDNFPATAGRIDRVLYSRPDWDSRPHSVSVARGRVKAGSFPGDDTHMLVLRLATRKDLRLLVVPPDHPLAEQAMQVAADPANRWSAAHILAARAFDDVGNHDGEHWTDDGGSWWPREDGPPSFR